MVLYFAYGSNMNLRQMQERCPDGWEKVGIGYVDGYRLVFDGRSSLWKGGAVANIVGDREGKVWGVLFELKYEDCLDRYEGVPYVYTKKGVEVVLPQRRQRLKAFTYIRPKPEELGKPSRDYLNRVVEGAKENQLPEDWMAFLESHECMSDF